VSDKRSTRTTRIKKDTLEDSTLTSQELQGEGNEDLCGKWERLRLMSWKKNEALEKP